MGIFSKVDVMPVTWIGLLCTECCNSCCTIFMLAGTTGLFGFEFGIQFVLSQLSFPVTNIQIGFGMVNFVTGNGSGLMAVFD